MVQRVLEIASPLFLPEGQMSDRPLDAQALFGNGHPLALEIGCGIGDFILDLARQRPQTNYLAIDIYNKGCLRTCRRLEAAGIGNVRVMRLEARYLLAKYLPAESLSAVFVNCPDPWPKKRHRRRRLVNEDFLRHLLRHLRRGGDFFFCTDFADYAEDVARLLTAEPAWRNALAVPFTVDLPGDYPVSKYMRRFLARGLPLHFLHFRKGDEVRTDSLQLPSIRPGFRIAWSTAANE
jgi:tRNA (guanine-N7-)-methyltransferase